MRRLATPLALVLAAAACSATHEAPPSRDARLAADDPRALAELEAAREAHETDPTSEENVIWLGRRLAYLGRYDEAIAVYTRGLARWPDSHRLLRHRGHRYITVRRFDLAEQDLARASLLVRDLPDEVEPDGRPNAHGVPRSTTNSNVEYHLALALYLQGRFDESLDAWRRCLEWSRVNDDMLVATTSWTTMTLRRLGRPDEADELLEPIGKDMEILENTAYHRLLLVQKGLASADAVLAEAPPDSVDFATRGYGIANLALVDGRVDEAGELLDRVLASDADRAAFGVIAAEVERDRLRWLR